MVIRPYKSSDDEQLGGYLVAEGWRDNRFYTHMETFILCDDDYNDIGFFTLQFKREVPYLQHFYLKPDDRNITNALSLVKYAEVVLKMRGYVCMIVPIPLGADYLNKLVRWYWKEKPYVVEDGHTWYLVRLKD